jgi:hypothetical protein
LQHGVDDDAVGVEEDGAKGGWHGWGLQELAGGEGNGYLPDFILSFNGKDNPAIEITVNGT